MTKELLQIEFRYRDAPNDDGIDSCKSKTVTVGVYDTLEEAVKAGNTTLEMMKVHFEVRPNDRFAVCGLFGRPTRLVTNCCYARDGVQYFATIKKLDFAPVADYISAAFEAAVRFKEYEKKQHEDA